MNDYANRLLRAFAVIALAAAAQACSSKGDKQIMPAEQNPVGFSIRLQQSRAVETTTQSLDRIGVFGYSTPTSGWDENNCATYAKADYFLNKMVVRTNPDAASWWYDGPTKYWPGENEGLLTFFAYAPYVDVQDIFTHTPTAIVPTGAPRIAYTPHADAIRQIDILWDKQADMGLPYDGTVRFEMKHALTSIAFEAKVLKDEEHIGAPFTIEILSVGIEGAIASGVFGLDDGMWALDEPADESELASYKLTTDEHKGLNSVIFHCGYDPVETPGYTDPFAGTGFVTLNKSYATLMILPQEFRKTVDRLPEPPIPGTMVFIEYRTVNLLTGEVQEFRQETELYGHQTAGGVEWGTGTGIVYRFTISLFDGVTVRSEAGTFFGLEKWVDGGEGAINVN